MFGNNPYRMTLHSYVYNLGRETEDSLVIRNQITNNCLKASVEERRKANVILRRIK